MDLEIDLTSPVASTQVLIHNFYNRISSNLISLEQEIASVNPYIVYGRIISTIGTILIAYMPHAKIGDLCIVFDNEISLELYAEIIAIDSYQVKLLPFGNTNNISQNCQVKVLNSGFSVNIGDWMLGKVVNGFGEVSGSVFEEKHQTNTEINFLNSKRLGVNSAAPDPLARPLISKILPTGVAVIDLFTTCGLGQRIGIFAGPGMGKTTLMGMIIRNSKVDIVVVGLIGERGREVREFIELELGQTSDTKCVLVVATSDKPPIEQVKCAYVAQTIAEYFRDQGKNVLLFIDSITRFARAQREVGLSAGEPITRGGYTPSTFLAFPKLMERAGINQHGSITAFYTILMEGEHTHNDAVADEVRSIIDGHIVLSRKMAESGQFPAVNVLSSLSRVADRIVELAHLNAARHIRMLLSKHEELEFLIRVGEYKPGQDKISDEAIAKYPKILNLIKQNQHENVSFDTAVRQLIKLAKE